MILVQIVTVLLQILTGNSPQFHQLTLNQLHRSCYCPPTNDGAEDLRFRKITGHKMQMRNHATFICLTLACLLGHTASSLAQSSNASDDLQMSARYHVESGTDRGFLIVKLVIPKGSHIYGLNQKKPLSPSKIVVKNDKKLAAGTSFKSDRKPTVVENDPVFQTRVEKHSGTVQFFVPIRVNTSTDFKTLKPAVTFSGQICSDKGFCKLINNKTTHAQFAGFFDREAKKPPMGIK